MKESIIIAIGIIIGLAILSVANLEENRYEIIVSEASDSGSGDRIQLADRLTGRVCVYAAKSSTQSHPGMKVVRDGEDGMVWLCTTALAHGPNMFASLRDHFWPKSG